MDRKHNSKIVPFAKELRKNMTKEERHLWYDFLREYPMKFTRQKVLGKYIADFYCAKANIVIELDGSGKVIRISNLDILKNFDGVCMCIDNVVKQSLSQLR